jgi:photosynthetic reaction center cytochrome c subunit
MLLAGGLLAACERPPMQSEQRGYRGLAIQQVHNPRTDERVRAANPIPDVLPAVQAEGPPVSQVYKNVKVLGDLTVPEFARVMAAMTTWVSPTQGCAYCHNVADMASDDPYQKVVARRMLEMTRHLNTAWTTHVKTTGVTCYTCHRGQNVPSNVWFHSANRSGAMGAAAGDEGQNSPEMSVGLTSMIYDPLTPYLEGSKAIHIQSMKALPSEDSGYSIKTAEGTYSLMMYISGALGVNCTFCHNSRAFENWAESAPQRVQAWYGIRMVRDLNNQYLKPLKATFPHKRLGPLGDAPKVNCTTCHQGVSKPLYGTSLFRDFPELGAARTPVAPPAPEAPSAGAKPKAAAKSS